MRFTSRARRDFGRRFYVFAAAGRGKKTLFAISLLAGGVVTGGTGGEGGVASSS